MVCKFLKEFYEFNIVYKCVYWYEIWLRCSREELERLRKAQVLSELCVSFSRDEDRGDNKRYVQDNLQSHGPALIELIEEKAAVVFVCGDAKNMAKTVNDTFVDLYQSCKGE